MMPTRNENTSSALAAAMEAEKAKRAWGKIVPARLDAVLRHAGRRVLDVGCSGGAYVAELRRRGYDARGVDLLVDAAWRGDHLDRFQRADAGRLPFVDDSFDTVTSFEVLEHTVDPERVLREFHRVAVKNIVISVPNCEQPPEFADAGLAFHHWVDRTHRQTFTPESIRRLLVETGFRVERIEPINRVHPQILCLSTLRLPPSLVARLSRLIDVLPILRRYHMTLLVVASREPDGRA